MQTITILGLLVILIITFISIIVLIAQNRIFSIFGDPNRYKNVIDRRKL